MKMLSSAMAETAFLQYSGHLNKMELHEFIAFAKVRPLETMGVHLVLSYLMAFSFTILFFSKRARF
jgi:hypothetical protein